MAAVRPPVRALEPTRRAFGRRLRAARLGANAASHGGAGRALAVDPATTTTSVASLAATAIGIGTSTRRPFYGPAAAARATAGL